MTAEDKDMFERVLDIQEKSIKTVSRLAHDVHDLIKEFGTVNGNLEKLCSKLDEKEAERKNQRVENEKVLYWLKFFGYLITFIVAIIGTVGVILNQGVVR